MFKHIQSVISHAHIHNIIQFMPNVSLKAAVVSSRVS